MNVGAALLVIWVTLCRVCHSYEATPDAVVRRDIVVKVLITLRDCNDPVVEKKKLSRCSCQSYRCVLFKAGCVNISLLTCICCNLKKRLTSHIYLHIYTMSCSFSKIVIMGMKETEVFDVDGKPAPCFSRRLRSELEQPGRSALDELYVKACCICVHATTQVEY